MAQFGHIIFDEAVEEFKKLYVQKAYTPNKKPSHAAALGAHRNTISKRVNPYRAQDRKHQGNRRTRLSRNTH